MNGITNTTQSSDAWELQKEYLKEQDKVGQTKEKESINQEDTSTNNSSNPLPSNTDEYIHSEKPSPTGIYQLGRDKDGKPKIVFDSQQNTSKPSEEAAKTVEDEKENETCTVNTNKVDSEVKKLKNKITTLKQQIAKASDNERENLEKQLEQLESELSMKDNDSYRRQHSSSSIK